MLGRACGFNSRNAITARVSDHGCSPLPVTSQDLYYVFRRWEPHGRDCYIRASGGFHFYTSIHVLHVL